MKSKRDLTLLGVKFRNNKHRKWFLLVASVFAIWLYAGLLNGFQSSLPHFILQNCAVAFISLGLIAACHTVFVGKKESGSFSVDCIWFNPLAGCILLIAHFATR